MVNEVIETSELFIIKERQNEIFVDIDEKVRLIIFYNLYSMSCNIYIETIHILSCIIRVTFVDSRV